MDFLRSLSKVWATPRVEWILALFCVFALVVLANQRAVVDVERNQQTNNSTENELIDDLVESDLAQRTLIKKRDAQIRAYHAVIVDFMGRIVDQENRIQELNSKLFNSTINQSEQIDGLIEGNGVEPLSLAQDELHGNLKAESAEVDYSNNVIAGNNNV